MRRWYSKDAIVLALAAHGRGETGVAARVLIAKAEGLHVVRVPYCVQLDQMTLSHFFGLDAIVQRDFPHGFITTKLFPASFCGMGVGRFERELEELPGVVREAVVRSLVERAHERGAEYVVPRTLRTWWRRRRPHSPPRRARHRGHRRRAAALPEYATEP